MLFANDAVVAAHNPSQIQFLMNRFFNTYTAFGLTISLKEKTNVLAQANASPYITINNYQLEVVDESTYLRSTKSSKLSLD